MRSLAAFLVVGAVGVVGCGGSDSSSTKDSQAPGANNNQMTAYRDCIKAQGAELPGRGAAGGAPAQMTDAQSAKLQKATAACRDKLPQGAGMGGRMGGGYGPPGGGAGPPAGVQIPQQ